MLLYLESLWSLFVDMSFYIVIGLIFTGLLQAFVKKGAILKHIGKDNTSSVIKASIIGVPLPLCSCGVVPTAMYLGKSGASKGSVVSFLTSTPQTGVDSIIATYGMMGPLFAIYRAISAFLSGIISGVITNVFCKKDKINYGIEPASCNCTDSHVEKEKPSNCCSDKDKNAQGFVSKIKSAFGYAFGEFLDEISVNFVIGLLLAALISAFLPTSILSNFSNPLLSMLFMVIIGIPMYICSTASIPIAVSLMLKGISPGAAFVFLFAGPVTNVASLVILVKSLGKKVTIIYLASVATCAVAFGLLLDYIINITGYRGVSNVIHASHEVPIYMTLTAIVFGVLVLKSVLKNLLKK